jgi:hypothetical protein
MDYSANVRDLRVMREMHSQVVRFESWNRLCSCNSRSVRKGHFSKSFQDTTTGGKSQTFEGTIDKTNQRAAWSMTSQKRLIVETGVANLTHDQAPAPIQFSEG